VITDQKENKRAKNEYSQGVIDGQNMTEQLYDDFHYKYNELVRDEVNFAVENIKNYYEGIILEITRPRECSNWVY